MVDMKLGKLPDRTPVKYTISVPPALNKRLMLYTELYNETHAKADPEKLEDIMPFILEAFLDGDRGFARAQKQRRAVENGALKEASSVAPRSRAAN